MLVKQALDILMPTLPRRLPIGDNSCMPIWIRYTKKILVEEGHSIPNLIHIFQLIVRHSDLFYCCRAQFVPQMVNSLNRLSLPYNTTSENRRLAIELAGLVVNWERQRQNEMKIVNAFSRLMTWEILSVEQAMDLIAYGGQWYSEPLGAFTTGPPYIQDWNEDVKLLSTIAFFRLQHLNVHVQTQVCVSFTYVEADLSELIYLMFQLTSISSVLDYDIFFCVYAIVIVDAAMVVQILVLWMSCCNNDRQSKHSSDNLLTRAYKWRNNQCFFKLPSSKATRFEPDGHCFHDFALKLVGCFMEEKVEDDDEINDSLPKYKEPDYMQSAFSVVFMDEGVVKGKFVINIVALSSVIAKSADSKLCALLILIKVSASLVVVLYTF
ncbi:transformation/transcription domain-associated protein-like protein [Tanacetum coccineum]